MRILILSFLISVFCRIDAQITSQELFTDTTLQRLPSAFKGRFRPVESYARLWLYDTYHNEHIIRMHRQAFHSSEGSALDLLWKMHFLGHTPWDNAPFFHVHNKSLIRLLQLDSSQDHFSYNQLFHSIYENKETNLRFTKLLMIYHFLNIYHDPSNRSRSEKLELASLAPGLWVMFQNDDIIAASGPIPLLWQQIEPGMLLIANGRNLGSEYIQENKRLADDGLNLLTALNQYTQINGPSSKQDNAFASDLNQMLADRKSPREIALALETRFPIYERLMHVDPMLKVLPGYRGEGEWLPLKALKINVYNPNTQKLQLVGNFTLYPDEQFDSIRRTYLALENAVLQTNQDVLVQTLSRQLATLLNNNYASLAETSYKESTEKTISYPSIRQLGAEVIYTQYPWIALTIITYAFSAGLLLLAMGIQKRSIHILGLIFLIFAFCLHTSVLALRCYILGRPPVSNMFETVIYVPWIAVLASFLLYRKLKSAFVLIASSLVALVLLTVLQVTNISSGLENVQAVLDSQYWLIIHVLLVVGSYGVFALSGILGHLYLIFFSIHKREIPAMQFINKCTIQSIYLGVAMLIPGTILGGVWAAESWGRFWDWDPKESWAFISICIYLIWIHAYTFHHIKNFGLAVGAVIGLIAISFTWYGVNYVLGTGLHSYGFGSGGEAYYYSYLVGELLFLAVVCGSKKALSAER
jgi:ABC-type transport system involved in cytochrome c biogenesis permease subunit